MNSKPSNDEMDAFLSCIHDNSDNLFHFAHSAMSHPNMLFMSTDDAYDVFSGWIDRTCSVPDEESALEELCDAWERLREHGAHVLARAASLAEKMPQSFPRKKTRSEKYYAFLNCAYWLDKLKNLDYIILPTDKMAETIGVSEMQITRYRRWAIRDGYLAVKEAHVPHSRATRFSFIQPS